MILPEFAKHLHSLRVRLQLWLLMVLFDDIVCCQQNIGVATSTRHTEQPLPCENACHLNVICKLCRLLDKAEKRPSTFPEDKESAQVFKKVLCLPPV